MTHPPSLLGKLRGGGHVQVAGACCRCCFCTGRCDYHSIVIERIKLIKLINSYIYNLNLTKVYALYSTLIKL